MRDLIEIVRRLPWIVERREFPATPWPWKRCHCGALADYRDFADQNWCSPCKFVGHPTCECSRDDDFSSPLGTVTPPAAEGGRPGGEATAPAAPRRDMPDSSPQPDPLRSEAARPGPPHGDVGGSGRATNVP